MSFNSPLNGLIQLTPKGLYCQEANLYIDPWLPAGNAIITHAHSDHARPGQSLYIGTPLTLATAKHRLGNIQVSSLVYGEEKRVNGVGITLFPAGHLPGSAQVRIRKGAETWVISGDYKCHQDGLSEPFEPIPCTHFISECTFGLPVFQWQAQSVVMNEINNWWESNARQGLNSIVFAYSLGKAQRILNGLNPAIGQVFAHGSIISINDVLRRNNLALPTCLAVDVNSKERLKGSLIIAPPSAAGTPWLRRFEPYRTSFASGWMAMRGSRRWQAADKGFVLSDHADWNELNQAIALTQAETVYLTHGYKSAFSRYLNEKGINAMELDTLFEGEQANASNNEETLTHAVD